MRVIDPIEEELREHYRVIWQGREQPGQDEVLVWEHKLERSLLGGIPDLIRVYCNTLHVGVKRPGT